MSIDQIYQDGRHYDRLFGERPPADFWLEQAAQAKGPILELACGTGRIAIPLAQRGGEVVGIDSSAAMLAQARHKAQAAGVHMKWVEGDMRDFALGQRFNLVLLANNALCHLLTLDDFERCMAAVRRHMLPDARLIIEVFVPNLHFLLKTEGMREPFAEYDDPDGGGTIVVTQTSHYDSATQIRYNTTYYQYPNRSEEVSGTLNMRMYFPQELDALLKYNGFAVDRKYGEQKYGGTDMSPFGADSTMQLLVLKKASDSDFR